MTSYIRNFLLQSWLSYRGLFLWLNPMGYVSNVFLGPAFLVAIFAIVGQYAQGAEAARSHIIGISVFSIALVTQGGVIQTMFYDRAFGTLSVNFASSGSRLSVYLSRGIFHFPNGLLALSSSLLAGWIFLDLSFHGVNWLLALAAVMVTTLSCVLFAMLVGAFAIAFRDWFIVGPAANGLTLGLTGAILPVDQLPVVLKQIGLGLPVTHGLLAFRSAFDGAAFASASHELLLESVIAVAYGICGYLIFRGIESWMKRRGTLEGVLG